MKTELQVGLEPGGPSAILDRRPTVGVLESGLIAAVSILVSLGIPLLGFWEVVFPAGAAVAAGLAFRFPAIGLVGLALLSPFDAYLPAVTVFKDLLWTDLLVFGALAGAARRLPLRASRSPEHAVASAALLALGVLQLFSMTFVTDWPDGLDNLLRYGYFAVVALVLPQAVSARVVRAAAIALVAGTVGRFCIEAMPYFGNPVFVLHPSYQFGVWTSNPNTLAGLASPVLPLALACAAGSRSRLAQVSLLACAGVIAGGLVLSFSKSAWLAALAGVAVLGILFRHRLWHRGVAVAALLVVLGLALIPQVRQVPGLMADRWTSAASTISNQERLKYLGVGYRLVREHPLFGVGLEQFPRAYQQTTGLPGPDDPHNAYLLIASELGIPALAMFLLFMGALWGGSLRAWQRGRRTSAAGVLAALVALAVFQLFSAEPWSSRVFWMLAALPWPLLDQDPEVASAT